MTSAQDKRAALIDAMHSVIALWRGVGADVPYFRAASRGRAAGGLGSNSEVSSPNTVLLVSGAKTPRLGEVCFSQEIFLEEEVDEIRGLVR